VPKRVWVNTCHKRFITQISFLEGILILSLGLHLLLLLHVVYSLRIFGSKYVYFHLSLNNINNNNILKLLRIQDYTAINRAYSSETRTCTTCRREKFGVLLLWVR